MSLSEPASREEIHCRQLTVRGYRRAAGLYDVEGHLTDATPFRYEMLEKTLEPGEPVHDMWLRLTIDRDLLVHAAEAWTASGPYGTCALVNPNFAVLAGLGIAAGWNRAVKERLGGPRGCTHLVEMLGQMATAAMQAIWTERNLGSDRPDRPDPKLLNSCYTYSEDSPMVKREWPELYTGRD